MIALIDYDNLGRLDRQRGVRHVVVRLLDVLGAWHPEWEARLYCRLYGGWFHQRRASRNAERLIPDLRREFPRTLGALGASGAQPVLVQVELARSLACDRPVALTHTYRRRSIPPRLRCEDAPFPACGAPSSCPIAALAPFVRDAECPVSACSVEPNSVLTREEQKLVDSMLIVDLIHFAEAADQPLVVVSADEDLWPGLRFVLLRGAHVIHVVPRRVRLDRDRYRKLETPTYSRIAI